MLQRLVTIETPTTPLDGVLYEPGDGPSRGCVQFFHGQTMNFYVGNNRFMPPALVAAGFTCLAYNRRSHDTLSTRDIVFRPEGSAVISVAESLEDNRIARQWLLDQGQSAPHLVGHSFGGMLAVAHAAEHPDTPSLSMLSPVQGGTGLLAATSKNGLLAADRLDEVTQQARALVAAGRGDEFMLVPRWWNVISAHSFLDLLTNTPDILQIASKVTCPVLALRGSLEKREVYPIEEFARLTGGESETVILEGAHHFYVGHEDRATDLVCDWIRGHSY
jgi:pimeloyl-ACP methyl ester carboxylesterase